MNIKTSGFSVSIVACVFLLTSILLADPAAPHNFRPLTNSKHLKYNTELWELKNGTVYRKINKQTNNDFVLIKKTSVKIPNWYNINCIIKYREIDNDIIPNAGIVIGYIDEKNYWILRPDGTLKKPNITLIQFKNGMERSVKKTSFSGFAKSNNLEIGIEVYEYDWLTISVNRKPMFKDRLRVRVPSGQFGMWSDSDSVVFSDISLSGIAKR